MKSTKYYKESAANARDLGSISGSGRSPGEGNGNSLQYSCLGNPMDRGAWGHKESDTTWQVNHHHHSIMYGIKY